MRIRVTTRADLIEERKQEHISFVAVSEIRDSDPVGELVARALNGHNGSYRDY